MVCEIQSDLLAVKHLDRLAQKIRDRLIIQALRSRKLELWLEPFGDGNRRSAFPFENRFEEFIFIFKAQSPTVQDINRLVQEWLKFISQLSILEKKVDLMIA